LRGDQDVNVGFAAAGFFSAACSVSARHRHAATGDSAIGEAQARFLCAGMHVFFMLVDGVGDFQPVLGFVGADAAAFGEVSAALVAGARDDAAGARTFFAFGLVHREAPSNSIEPGSACAWH
jgi:hypothetical protein